MPVFRATAGDPAGYRSSADPLPPAAVPQQRHPSPGDRVSPRTLRPAFPDGPTEPLNASTEVANRTAASREAAAAHDAAAREAAVREAAARDAVVRAAAARDAAVREAAAARDAAARQVAARDAVAAHDAVVREAAAREVAAREVGAAWEVAAHEVAARKAATGEAAGREAIGGETAGRVGATSEAARGEPARKSSADANAGPGRAGATLAVLFSLLALLAATAAGLFSWRTFEAVRAARSPQPATVPAAATPRTPAARPPQPEQYRVVYAKEPLRLQLSCAAVLHLDLDEPRADVAENLADLRYEGGCGARPPRLSIGAGAAAASIRASADTDAGGCDRAVRTSPLGRGLQVTVQKDTALCVLTAEVPAELVLVEIIDVGGSGTADLRATSWQVP